jgi:hypothetical protein
MGEFWRGGAVVSGETLYACHWNPISYDTLYAWTLTDAGRFTQTASAPVAATTIMSQIRDFGGMIAVANGYVIQLFDCTNPNSISLLAAKTPPACSVWANLAAGDGAPQRGVWAALGEYGVFHVPAVEQPAQ